jgi:signal transduction histidine kinase
MRSAPPVSVLTRGTAAPGRTAVAPSLRPPASTPAGWSGRPRPDSRREGLARRYRSAQQVVLSHTLITDAVFALLMAVISTPWLATTDPRARSWLLQAGLLVPLIWRRRYPSGVFVVVSVVAAIQWTLGVQLAADLALLVALSTLATYRSRRAALTAAAVLEIGALLASLRWSLAGSAPRSLVFLSGLVAAALLLGTNLSSRRALVASLTQRADRLERERDQQARIVAAAERTRIAREMHDVIGHSLAVMVSLADGAGAKLANDPARAATAIGDVSALGRQALGETRRLLGVLRADDAGDGFAPQPDLARLSELVAQVRATGLAATLRREGDPTGLSTGLQLTVYRIVQEAITNVLKHAATPTEILVRVAVGGRGVDVEVWDNGRGIDGEATAADPGASLEHGRGPAPERGRGPAPETDPGRDGQGLTGMQERVAVYGGSMTAGPEIGGWAVRVHLPTTGP